MFPKNFLYLFWQDIFRSAGVPSMSSALNVPFASFPFSVLFSTFTINALSVTFCQFFFLHCLVSVAAVSNVFLCVFLPTNRMIAEMVSRTSLHLRFCTHALHHTQLFYSFQCVCCSTISKGSRSGGSGGGGFCCYICCY